MSKVQYNVGYLKGQLGDGNLYSALTDSGIRFIVYKHQITVEGAPVEKWMFLPKSSLQAHMDAKQAFVDQDIKIADLPETAPTGVLNPDGYVTFSNDNSTLVRLYNNQGPYTLKGTGIEAYTGTIKLVTGSDSTIVISNAKKTLTESISEVVEWATKNWYIVLLIGFALSELMGWTNLLGLKTNKKKKLATARR